MVVKRLVIITYNNVNCYIFIKSANADISSVNHDNSDHLMFKGFN